MDRTTISVSRKQYQQLLKAKMQLERLQDRETDWGEFLVMLASGALIGYGLSKYLERKEK